MPTRAEMVTEIQGYMHRSDTAIPWDTFVSRANDRIGQDFRTTANTQTVSYAVSGALLLPADFKEIIYVQGSANGQSYALLPTGSAQSLDYLAAQGGGSYGYFINGGYLYLVPQSGTPITVSYYAALVLPAVGTNLMLTVYPQAYLWYGLMQCYLYIGASEESVNYLNLYLDEKDRANAVNRQKIQPISSVQGTTGIVVTAT